LTIDATTGAVTPSTSTPGNHTITYTIVAAAGCAQVVATANIIITKAPTATISYAGTPFCTSLTTGQAVTLTGTDAYTGGAYSSTAGLSVDATTGAITPSTSTAGNYVVTYTAPASAGCASVPTTTNVVITALPTAAISYAGTPFCTTLTTGQAVTLTGTAGYTGGVYSGTAGLTIDATTGAVTPSTSTPGNHTITYTIAAAAGCTQVVATANIIINPIPVATATPSAVTICSLDTTNIAISSNAIGATYVWTSTVTNASGASSASGTRIADALTVTGNTPGIVVYTITPTGSGCTGLPITATVTVNPLPTATISGNARICYNTSSTISFSGTPNATVTYTVNGGANQTTILDNVGQGIVSTGNLTATTTYQLVSVRSAGIPSCSQSQSGSVVVAVIPVPLVNTVVSSPTICSGQPTGISLSSNVASATYNWTITQSGVIGATAGNGSIISQILTATGVVPGTVTYSVMANEGVCQGPATPITITVNPIPLVIPSTILQSVCSGSVSPIQLTSNVTGTTFNWNVVQTNVTGASNGSGNIISQVLTSTSNNVGGAIYSITPTVGGCPGLPMLVTVRVNPIPVATANTALTTICSSSTTNIALTSSVAGTTFSWTVIQSGIFGASSGTGNTIAQTLTTVGTSPGSVIYTITPSINGCSGLPITVTVIVNPTPEVFGSSTSTICSGETPNITLFPSIAATTFAWTVNALNVSGAQAGTGVVINDVLTASPNLGTAIYTVTPTANGCSGIPLNITVNVNPAPAPQINDGVICVNQATGVSYKNYILDTNLSNATYDFAWYFNGVVINGAVNNSYEASQAGTYSVVVTNTATGCKSAVTQANVTASFPGTVISTTETLAFSDNATITVDVTGGNATFLYSLDNGPTQSSNVFTDVSPGSHVVTVTDANGCTNLTKLVSIIGYPTYFTPNGDGYHETWNIIGLGDTAKVYIFDRYGKLIKQISPTGEGWDGTYNGEPLMSTDYWFTVDYSEPQTGERRAFRSHFSLKR
jgi:gliding motility-associated-like protein